MILDVLLHFAHEHESDKIDEFGLIRVRDYELEHWQVYVPRGDENTGYVCVGDLYEVRQLIVQSVYQSLRWSNSLFSDEQIEVLEYDHAMRLGGGYLYTLLLSPIWLTAASLFIRCPGIFGSALYVNAFSNASIVLYEALLRAKDLDSHSPILAIILGMVFSRRQLI